MNVTSPIPFKKLPSSLCRRLTLALLLSALPLASFAAEGPVRLNTALILDQGFSVGLIHHSRFESIIDNVQPGTSKSDQLLAQRTLLDLGYRCDRFTAQLELADIRQQLADEETVLTAATVNAMDVLQANVAYESGVFGLYCAFNRGNLITPGVRLIADPVDDVNVMLSYRHYWLAEAKDSWGRTGLMDVTGNNGDYLGHHLQIPVRWNAVPGNVRIESGAILLWAENLSDKNTEYFYVEATFTC